jgi:hypothetical protein
MGFLKTEKKPILAISMAPNPSPWGGAIPFVWQLEAILKCNLLR